MATEGGADVHCDRVLAADGDATAFIAGLEHGETGCLRAAARGRGVPSIATPGVVDQLPGRPRDARGPASPQAGADGAVVENLTLDGRNPDVIHGPLIYADDVILRGNDITNTTRRSA